MRPERAFAEAFSVVGRSTVPGGLTRSTDGRPAASEERRELVARE
jgi:hypothetical protein